MRLLHREPVPARLHVYALRSCRLGDCLALRAPDATRVEALRQSRLPPVAPLTALPSQRISARRSEIVALVLRYADGAGCFPVENRNAPPLGYGTRQTPRRNCARRSHAPADRARSRSIRRLPPPSQTAASLRILADCFSGGVTGDNPTPVFPSASHSRLSPVAGRSPAFARAPPAPISDHSAVRLGRVKVTRSQSASTLPKIETESV